MLFAALMIISCAVAPAFAADDDDDDDAKPAAKTAQPAAKEKSKDKDTKEKSKPAAKSKGGGGKGNAIGKALGSASARTAAVIAGFAGGTPIAAVRLFAQADVEQGKSIPFLGESKHKPLVWAARMFVIPSAFFSGTVQAPVYSAMNAWRETEDENFSRESFFLGELEDRGVPAP